MPEVKTEEVVVEPEIKTEEVVVEAEVKTAKADIAEKQEQIGELDAVMEDLKGNDKNNVLAFKSALEAQVYERTAELGKAEAELADLASRPL